MAGWQYLLGRASRGGPPEARCVPFARVILIVIDSLGAGELPDAAAYGDEGSDTLGNLARVIPLALPHMRALGLGRVAALNAAPEPALAGAFGRMAEASPGKDSVTGHWEMAGIVLARPFPTFPAGFPQPVIDELERRIGRRTLGNVVASGTEIIDRLGAEHLRTGFPIVYTSADSVLQIAAHEATVPIDDLYRMCEAAFEIACRGLGVGRVIARPFEGRPGRVPPHRAAPRLCARAHWPDAARRPDGGRARGGVDWQGQRPLCRPGHLAVAADHERRRRHGASVGRAGYDDRRPAVREPGGLRHPARPSQRPGRLRPQPGVDRPVGRHGAARGSAPTICSSSPATTATTPRPRAPITPASTCRCCSPAPACVAAPTSACGRRSPTWARQSPTISASDRWRTAPASWRRIRVEHP